MTNNNLLLPFMFLSFLILSGILITGCKTVSGQTSKEYEEDVDFYPAYGYLEDDEWVIPLKLYIYEDRHYLESIVFTLFRVFRSFTPEEEEIFRERMGAFTADSESREIVQFVFDNDPENEIFTIRDDDGNPVRSDLHGIIKGEIRLPVGRAEALLEHQNTVNGWLTFTVVSEDHKGMGKVRLIEPEGVSIISDIDDTIKISEMPAGSRIAVRNAFYKPYAAAPEMVELFDQWRDKPVHYVSGTPRRFYRFLSEFLFSEEVNYPEGTFHLRDVHKHLFSLTTWGDLEDIITAENVTYNHKLSEMSKIVGHFPGREFILVGDSGQYDPEIFREIDATFPGQVKEIIIRDITNDRELNLERLEGMNVIPARTVEKGVSQFEAAE